MNDVANSSELVAQPSTTQTMRKPKRKKGVAISNDECDIYGQYVAVKLRNYLKSTRTIVKRDILDILINADFGPFFTKIRNLSASPQMQKESQNAKKKSRTVKRIYHDYLRTSGIDGPLSFIPAKSLNSRIIAANHRNPASWWAPIGEGPLCSWPDNLQISPGLSVLKGLCETVPLYAMEDNSNRKLYGKVEVKGDRIFINHLNKFQNPIRESKDGPEPRFIPLKELLHRFTGSTELPKVAFLKLHPSSEGDSDYDSEDEDDDKAPFFLLIETDGITARAKNFNLLVASFGEVPTFYSSDVEKNQSNCSFPVSRSSSTRAVHVVGHDDQETPLKEGGVYGLETEDNSFKVQLKDEPSVTGPKFGTVVAGLQRLKRLQYNCLIMEQGFVIYDKYRPINY